MLSSLLSWSFSLIFSALLAKSHHRVRGADYRAVGAAVLGLGSIWALGLSSSAALIMAAPGSLPASILKISGVIPLSQTLGLWQSVVMALVLGVLSAAIALLPRIGSCTRRREMGVEYLPTTASARQRRPGSGWNSVKSSRCFSADAGSSIWREVADKGQPSCSISIICLRVPDRRIAAARRRDRLPERFRGYRRR